MRLPSGLARRLSKQLLTTKRNSPHIFFGAGMVGVLGGAVLACRGTLKLEDTLDEIKTDFDAVTDMSGYDEVGKEKYSKTQYRKDVGYVYAKGGVKLAKLYGPAIVVGGFGIAALTGSHVQLTKRNAALTATLASVMKAFEAYRERIKEELGEERELELYRDTREETAEIDGKKQTVKTVNPTHFSVYAKCFDEYNSEWKPSAELNRLFLQAQQKYANDKLHAQGYLMLNDVYDMLGFDRTQAGCVVGWAIDADNPESDGYVDYGIFEAMNAPFVNGQERAIWLDFNVDGIVQYKIRDET